MRTISLLSLLIFIAYAPVNAQLRLTSIANAQMQSGVFTPTDSTAYNYQGTMTSNMKTGIINYDSAIQYLYVSGSYKNNLLKLQSFNGIDSVTLYREYNWADTSSSWVSNLDVSTNFDMASNLPTSRNVMYVGGADYNLYYHYGTFTDTILQVNSTLDTVNRVIHSYDSWNLLINTLIQNWVHTPMPGFQNLFETDYSYSVSNLDSNELVRNWDLTTMTWLKYSVTKYTYDASNRRAKVNYSTYVPGTGLVPSTMDSNVFDSYNNVIISTRSLYDTGSHTYQFYNQHVWSYDTSRPLVLTSYSWTGTAFASLNGQDNQTHWHYAPYLYITPLNKAVGSFDIFPIPAQTVLNIRMKWDEPQPFTISIYDMQGRIYMHSMQSANPDFQKAIPVAGLPSGNYIVRIKATNTDLKGQFTICR